MDIIERVVALANRAQMAGDFPVGALVIFDGDIIGEGWNQKESHHDPTAHAEVMAIRAAAAHHQSWRLTGATLVSTLEPCPMCLGAALQARIDTVVFLAHDWRWGACGSVMDFSSHAALNHRCHVQMHPNDDVVSMMTQFFKLQGKR